MLLSSLIALQLQQPLAGLWHGTFKPGRESITVLMELRLDGQGWQGSVRSPQMGEEAAKLESLKVDGKELSFRIPDLGASYTGTLDAAGERIRGSIRRKSALTLDFARGWPERPLVRSQTPKLPLPYSVEPLKLTSRDGTLLSATLTVPKGVPAAVCVLFGGSGPQDRDCTILDHKPLLVMADQLARNGIASIRWDDRGVGESSGVFAETGLAEMTEDGPAALDAVRARWPQARMGVVGLSQGCIPAWKLAEHTDAVHGAFLLSPVAGDPWSSISRASGPDVARVAQELSRLEWRAALAAVAQQSAAAQEPLRGLLGERSSFESLTFRFRTIPRSIQAYAVLGGRDEQYSATDSVAALGKIGIKCEVIRDANHLMQPCRNGAMSLVRENPVTLHLKVIKWLADGMKRLK